MEKGIKNRSDSDRSLYLRQNKTIHKARAQIGMSLCDCRLLAKQLGKKTSLSSLTLRRRWELIEILKAKGAKVYNPPLSQTSMENHGNPKNVYPERLVYWSKRFPKGRPGFATVSQLAWIETLWLLDFDDGRTGGRNGLRGFIWRQTKGLKDGPISDLAFLRDNHVAAVMTPLRAKAKQRFTVMANSY